MDSSRLRKLNSRGADEGLPGRRAAKTEECRDDPCDCRNARQEQLERWASSTHQGNKGSTLVARPGQQDPIQEDRWARLARCTGSGLRSRRNRARLEGDLRRGEESPGVRNPRRREADREVGRVL